MYEQGAGDIPKGELSSSIVFCACPLALADAH